MSLKDVVKGAKKAAIENRERRAQTWTPTKIRDLIVRNNVFVERALCVLLARQTADEVQAEATAHHNKMGFTSADAKLLSSFAKQIQTNPGNYPEGKRLSPKQLYYARKKLVKYAKQLSDYANNKDLLTAQLAVGVAPTEEDMRKGGVYRKVDYGEKEVPPTEENLPSGHS